MTQPPDPDDATPSPEPANLPNGAAVLYRPPRRLRRYLRRLPALPGSGEFREPR
jgi:hypothetical protein